MPVTLEQLRVLHMIIREGTFHGAAKSLNKSQPALSQMIRKLEEQTGLDILSREQYRPELTVVGRAFYQKSLHVVDAMQQLDELTASLRDAHEAELHLAVTATCDLAPILTLIHQVRQDYPHTHIRLSVDAMGGPMEKLMTNQADMIIASMDGASHDQVQAVPYEAVRILPVCHRDYAPAQNPGPKSAADMRPYPQIVVTDASGDSWQQSRDVLPDTSKWNVSDFASKKAIISAAMGWGGMPEHMVRDELAAGDLVALQVEQFPVRHSRLLLMRQRSKAPGPVAQALWDRCRKQGPGIE